MARRKTRAEATYKGVCGCVCPAHPQTRLYIGTPPKETKGVWCLRHEKWTAIKDETLVIRRVPIPRPAKPPEQTPPLF